MKIIKFFLKIIGIFLAICFLFFIFLYFKKNFILSSSGKYFSHDFQNTNNSFDSEKDFFINDETSDILDSARKQIGKTISYDPSYVRLDYPMGDVSFETGVCTDVIIRALRDARRIDLQELIHNDMRESFLEYPQIWNLDKPDSNIDHRRVPNIQKYFERMGYEIPLSKFAKDYNPGDIVTADIFGRPHIMIVSNKKNFFGRPYVVHNSGLGTKEEDVLFYYRLTGHYRIEKK